MINALNRLRKYAISGLPKVTLCLSFKTSPSANSHENENEPVREHFLKEWFPTTRFDTEVKCNLKMAYYILQSWTTRSQ